MKRLWSFLKAHPPVLGTLICAMFLSALWLGAFSNDRMRLSCAWHSTLGYRPYMTLDIGRCKKKLAGCRGNTPTGQMDLCRPCAVNSRSCLTCGGPVLFGFVSTLSEGARTAASVAVLLLALASWIALVILVRRARAATGLTPPEAA